MLARLPLPEPHPGPLHSPMSTLSAYHELVIWAFRPERGDGAVPRHDASPAAVIFCLRDGSTVLPRHPNPH